MNTLKNKLLLYKNLMTYLVLNQDNKDSKINSFYKNVKFEIKLYLIGLSFNRFLFNVDKMLFMLCIITNFLYFLSFQNPRILFLGEFIAPNASLYKKSSKLCGQLFFEKFLLPGSVTNIKMVEEYYSARGKSSFTKHLDCIFSFFCTPIAQALLEAKSLSIPIVGLVELQAKDISSITYPLVCNNNLDTIYFFINYFVKIINSQNLELKSKLHFSSKKKKKIFVLNFSEKRMFHTNNILLSSKNINKISYSKKQENLESYIPKVLFFNIFLQNFVVKNKPFYYNYNRFFNIYDPFFYKTDLIDKFSLITSPNIPFSAFNLKFLNFIFSMKLLAKEVHNNSFVDPNSELNLLSQLKRFNETEYPEWYKKKLKLLEALPKNKKFIKNNFFWNNQKNKVSKSKEKKINEYETFDFNKWADKLRTFLKSKNIYANRSLNDRDKDFFLREFIINDLKNAGITIKHLRVKNKVVSTKYPYIEQYVKKEYVEKKNEPVLAKHIVGTWEYRKWKLFTATDIPKKRKKLKRLKFSWSLKWLTKLEKRHSPTRYLCVKRPRAVILKKKVLIKKLVHYYYSFPLGKNLKSIIKYSNKVSNKVTINTTRNLMNVFESHLGIFIFRCKLAPSMLDAKSLITGGGILVNGKIVYNPGYILRLKDIVQLHPDKRKDFLKKFIKINKPKRWRKNRFFFKLKVRNRLSKKLLGKRFLKFGNFIKKDYLGTFFKWYWKTRNFSSGVYERFLTNVLTFKF